MRTVRDIIDSKKPLTNIIAPDAMVIDALRMLSDVNLSYLIVMEGDEYKGIFSERDYSRNVVLKGKTSSTSTVGETMTTDVPEVDEDDTIEHCMDLVNSQKTRYLVAFDEKKLATVVTIHDLLRQVLSDKDLFNSSIASQLIDDDERGVY